MERTEVLAKVIKLTEEKLVVKKNIKVTEDTSFQDDLNADSIDITDFVMGKIQMICKPHGIL